MNPRSQAESINKNKNLSSRQSKKNVHSFIRFSDPKCLRNEFSNDHALGLQNFCVLFCQITYELESPDDILFHKMFCEFRIKGFQYNHNG